VWRTASATGCSSPKLTAPTTIPCTWRRRKISAHTRASLRVSTQPTLVSSGLGTTTSMPAPSIAATVMFRILKANSSLNDPRLAGTNPSRMFASWKGMVRLQ